MGGTVAYKEFVTAIEEKVKGGPEPITLTLGKEYADDDGVVLKEVRDVTFHPPVEGQVALMMARMGRHSSTNDKIAGLIDFFVEILDEEDHQYIVNRLLDRHDPFGVSQITEVMTHIVGEWGQRPTK